MGTYYQVSDFGVARFGTTVNNVTIDTNGISFSGALVRKNLVTVSCTELADGGTAPGSGITGATFYREFDPSINQSLFGHFIFPNDYEVAGSLRVKLHWAPDNTDTGDVAWAIGRDFTNEGDLITGVSSTVFTSTAPGTANAMTIATATLSAASANPGTNFAFFISRAASNASDTFTGNARLLSLSLEYDSDKV